jgi:hypothetical protein
MSLALTARRRVLTWGATTEEATARLPGDELLEDAKGVSTRAITIAAPTAAVWPWLAQMGPLPRGGAYTYDWVENLFGLNMHSVDRVLPEFQDPQIGDTIGFGSNRMRIERVEPGRVLSWRSEDGNWVWTFVLGENDGTTRLISRNRFRLSTLGARIGMVPMEPASLVMERKMLLGIKERAERLASAHKPMPTETVEFLTSERETIIGTAKSALGNMSARHYEEAGAIEVGRRLEALFDRVSESLAAQDLGPIIGHAREIARERFNSGYDLVEVQAAFNALEAAVWTRVFTVLEPGQFAQTLGFVSTILGAAKDALAREYVYLATDAHAPSLDLRALFAGTEDAFTAPE